MRLVLFDGTCAMCDAAVRLWIRVDRDRVLRYAPLQGSTAAELRAACPEIPNNIESMIFFDEGDVFLRMKAVGRGARYLHWPWKAVYALFFLPAWFTDPIYRFIARNRFRVFGKKEICRVIAPHERDLFLP